MQEIHSNEGTSFSIDLPEQTITTGSGNIIKFDIDEFRKQNLLLGLDDIGMTLQNVDKIDEYEARQQQTHPWLWK